MGLTQDEAERLIEMPKIFETDEPLILGQTALDYTR